MTIVLQFFPNGEFSQGVDTSKRRKEKRRDAPTQTLKPSKERRDEYLQWFTWYRETYPRGYVHAIGGRYMSPLGRTYILRILAKSYCCLEWHDDGGALHTTTVDKNFTHVFYEWRLTPLVHQSVESCENPESLAPTSSRKKLEAMTKNMARNVRNGVYLLEQQPGGKDCLSFLTLTLPNLSTKGLDDCCQNWDYMVKRFLDWLRTKVESQGMNFMYVYATEIQTKRLEKRHEYCPHLHLVFRGRNGKKQPWVISPKQARKAWSRCIASVVNERFCDSALENLQRIRFSAARYLSKYLSKGQCKIPAGAKEYTISALRTQWAGMARSISRLIKQTKVRVGGNPGAVDLVFKFLKGLPELRRLGYIRYFKEGFIALGVDNTTGMEYGLHVCTGALSTPAFEGGLNPIFNYLFS